MASIGPEEWLAMIVSGVLILVLSAYLLSSKIIICGIAIGNEDAIVMLIPEKL
jgi:hypothetical protein